MMKKILFLIMACVLAIGTVAKLKYDQVHDRSAPAVSPETAAQTPFTGAEKPAIEPGDVKLLQALDDEYTNLVETVMPSVVSVTTSRIVQLYPRGRNPVLDLFGLPGSQGNSARQQRIPAGVGSGVIVSQEGHIVTNYHVVASGDQIKVQLNDGRIADAKVIGGDQSLDIAVLKVGETGLRPLPFAEATRTKVGQLVFAIGSPFGFEETVTSGIVSAIGRPAVTEMGSEFVQTNADINPGNSGGPLINLRGEIVGINTWIFSQTGASVGIGFAIPSDIVRRALESIINTGGVERGYLGISMGDVTPDLAKRLKVRKGAVVDRVGQDSPAEHAGLRADDVIVSIGTRRIDDSASLRTNVLGLAIGEAVEMRVVRAGQEIRIAVTIGKAPENYFTGGPRGSPGSSTAPADRTRSPLEGVEVVRIPARQRRGLSRGIEGVMVSRVDADSPASGVLQPSDIIEEVDQQPVSDPEQFAQLLQDSSSDKHLLSIIRGRTRSFVVVR